MIFVRFLLKFAKLARAKLKIKLVCEIICSGTVTKRLKKYAVCLLLPAKGLYRVLRLLCTYESETTAPRHPVLVEIISGQSNSAQK